MSSKKCAIESCKSLKHSGRYCGKHEYRLYKLGDLNKATVFDKRPAIIEAEIAKIPLGLNAKDGYAIIDSNLAWIDKHQWHKNSAGYAVSRINKKYMLLHKLLIDGNVIDHINRNKLDNRLVNLRSTTQSMNCFNTPISSKNTSGYRGVSWDTTKKKWNAYINVKLIRKNLGYFRELDSAVLARKVAEGAIYE